MMIDPGFYKALEERLGPVVGIAGSAAIVLYTLGYLSLRFWLRAVGLTPDLGLLNEVYLFEGAALVIFLLTIVPLLLAAALAAGAAVWLVRRIGPVRRGLDALVARVRRASPGWVAVAASLWAVATVQFFLRHVLRYRDLVHDGVPCDPAWLPPVALSRGPAEGLFFGLLLLLPIPTLYAVGRLTPQPAWRPATILLGLVAIVQVVLVPIHYGVLVSQATVPRLLLPDVDDGTRVWELHRSSSHVHLLVQDDGQPPVRRVRVVPVEEWGSVEIEAVDSFYGILTEGRTCGR